MGHPICGSDATLLITNNSYMPMLFTVILIKDPSHDIELSHSSGIILGKKHLPIKVTLKRDSSQRTADMFYIKVIASPNTKIKDENWFKCQDPAEKIITQKVKVILDGV